MLRRNLNSDFVGGAYVFPGGSVDPADAEAHDFIEGLDDSRASQRLSLDTGGLAYYIACLREVFEESGLLLARTQSGDYIKLTDDVTRERFAEHRRALNAQEITFREIIARENLRLDLTSLEYYSHWVTPIGGPQLVADVTDAATQTPRPVDCTVAPTCEIYLGIGPGGSKYR